MRSARRAAAASPTRPLPCCAPCSPPLAASGGMSSSCMKRKSPVCMAMLSPAHTHRRYKISGQSWVAKVGKVRSRSRARKRGGRSGGGSAPQVCASCPRCPRCASSPRLLPVEVLGLLLLAVRRISSFTMSHLSGVTSATSEGNQRHFASHRKNRRMAGVRACCRPVCGRCVPRASAQPQHGRSLQQPFSHKQPLARGVRATGGLAGASTSRIVGPAIRVYVT